MNHIQGLHHVTAIAGDAQENLDFYNHVLGMRLVKRSVNQDDPTTYHLFYADGAGHPGTDLTFFPWAHMERARPGVGLTSEVQLAVPVGSLDDWAARLADFDVDADALTTRFGERTLTLRDPHGLNLALVETSDERVFTPWQNSPVPADKQILGLHGARVVERDLAATERFITETLGFQRLAEEDGWHRYGLPAEDGRVGGSGRVLELAEDPAGRRGQWGVGGVHHLAWTVEDQSHELKVRERIQAAGRRPTDIIDRFWFKSVYFSEPGGVLFELATRGPGFGVDEDMSTLGERLILPPWLEPHRAQIEAALPGLELPRRNEVGA